MRTSARKLRSGCERTGSDRGKGLPRLLLDRARHGGVRARQRDSLPGQGVGGQLGVCYVLGITAVDPIAFKLPFERFLSATRDEEPDIDVDFDSDRREEVIQEVYRRYGRRNAAQVANVISYRPRSAVRDMAKALGYSTGQQDAWSKQIDSWGTLLISETGEDHGGTTTSSPSAMLDHQIPNQVVDLAEQLLKAPRHLGIHSGGMVLTERPWGKSVRSSAAAWTTERCCSGTRTAGGMGPAKFDFLG